MKSQDEDFPEMRDSRAAVLRQHLLDEMAAEEARTASRKRRRRITIGGLVFVATGSVAIAGTALLQSRPVSDQSIVHCYASAQPQLNGTYRESAATIAGPTNGSTGRIADALAVCSQMWQEGILTGPVDPLANTRAPGVVPTNLEVCVGGDGSAIVVPGNKDVCLSIGLAPLLP